MKKIEYDQATYKEFGNIYEGDYYKEIPFDDYIDKRMPLPEGDDVFDICSYGAVAEEGRLNTEAFQKAVEACKAAGGGTILVQGGHYLMGTVTLYSNMTLFIAGDSAIVASRDSSRFKGAFVIFDEGVNVKITGGGKICGNGEWYVYEPRKKPLLEPLDTSYLPPRDAVDINGVEGTMRYHYRQRIRYAEDKYGEGLPNINRPDFMVWMRGCANVIIENIIFEDAMNWTLNLDCCSDVLVKNVVINNNRHVANTDGIDVTGSSKVEIDHCFISTADDGIVLKNPEHTQRDMSNIHIHRCTVLTVMNAFKIGTETKFDISDVLVEDCHFTMPDIYPGTVSGISIESADGSHVNNIVVKNITMDKVTCPLFIALNMRNRYGISYKNQQHEDRPFGGMISNILIENIRAVDVEVVSLVSGFVKKEADNQFKNEARIVRKPISYVTIKNFEAVYRDNKEIINVPDVIEEYLYEYPENNNFGDVDAYGIWARHVDNITLTNINIKPRSANKRECIKLYDIISN